jgi:hypothetical protein
MPLPDFWAPRERKQLVRSLSGFGWANLYAYFTEVNIWPRGLPLDATQLRLPEFESLPNVEVDCPIQQGLADGDPDVDAIYRMVLPLPVRFRGDRQISIGKGTWCPFNSQNTAWFPESYPLLYLPSYCTFRMTDIWRSLVAQRIAFEHGWSILFRSPNVVQERNERNLMKDFADEIPGYLNNRSIGERLQRLELKTDTRSLGENLIRCYEELIRLGVVGVEEMALLKAWIQDIARLF